MKYSSFADTDVLISDFFELFYHCTGGNMLNKIGVQHSSTLLIGHQKMLNVDYNFTSN